MPNHVTNKVEITSSNAQEAINFMRSANKDFDFNQITAMPKALSVESGSITDAALAYALTDGLKSELTPAKIEKYFKDEFFSSKEDVSERDLEVARCLINDKRKTHDDLLKFGQQIIQNIDTYGCKTWYEWAPINWGTKWNAYEVAIEDNAVSFDTAWSSPEPVLTAWIAKFSLDCVVKAFDEGHNFWFIKRYQNGLLVNTRDTLKEDCNSLCKELKGYDPSKEDEDE